MIRVAQPFRNKYSNMLSHLKFVISLIDGLPLAFAEWQKIANKGRSTEAPRTFMVDLLRAMYWSLDRSNAYQGDLKIVI